MAKRKLCVTVQSRANYARIKTVLAAAQAHPDIELQLVVGASAVLYRFGRVVDVIREDGFEPTATVHSVVEGETPATMAKSTGLTIIELTTLYENLKPDVVLTVADRYETMATAIAASYMNIPLAHTQGGEVTGSIDESVRHAITKMAHIHFPSTQRAADYLIRMGEDPETVHCTGCPALDLLGNLNLPQQDIQTYFDQHGVGPKFSVNEPYIMVLQHPVTTEYVNALDQVQATLDAVRELSMPTIWLWPNIDAGSDSISKVLRTFHESHPEFPMRLYRHFPAEMYAQILRDTKMLVGNSSSGIREGSLLGTPVINIGSRQNARERGANVIDVPHEKEAILAAMKTHLEHGRYAPEHLYGDGKAGQRIVDILATADFNIQKVLHYAI